MCVLLPVSDVCAYRGFHWVEKIASQCFPNRGLVHVYPASVKSHIVNRPEIGRFCNRVGDSWDEHRDLRAEVKDLTKGSTIYIGVIEQTIIMEFAAGRRFRSKQVRDHQRPRENSTMKYSDVQPRSVHTAVGTALRECGPVVIVDILLVLDHNTDSYKMRKGLSTDLEIGLYSANLRAQL